MSDGRAPLSVLLVDDHAESLSALARLLKLNGFAVFTATTADEALLLAARVRFDAVVSDLGLPGGHSGLELMRELRAQYRLPGVALSGFTDEQDVAESMRAG